MNEVTYVAFADELEKIAAFWSKPTMGQRVTKVVGNYANKAFQGGKKLISEGWHGDPKTMSKREINFGKAMTVAGTALALPSTLSRTDPSGRGRSRTERAVGLAGGTAGGMIGGGLGTRALKYLPKSGPLRAVGGIAAPLIGGIAGSMIGDRVATSPWRNSRQALVNHLQEGAVDPRALGAAQ